MHLGGNNLQRWLRCVRGVPNSVIILATWQSVAFITLYAVLVTFLLPVSLIECAANSQLPLSFCGSAIGLLLVFRTNAAYGRLLEARKVWGSIVNLVAEIASKVAACESAEHAPQGEAEEGKQTLSTAATVQLLRYLVAFCWALRDELRDGDERDDILRLLIADPEEETWIVQSYSRPFAIHRRLRKRLHEEWKKGNIADHIIFQLEGQLAQLSSAASDCQRIFASPIPPTMSRHGLRSLLLWLLALPVVLAGSVPLWVNALWSGATAFVYLGIDELGVQVEQPFQILPLWQLCLDAQKSIVEVLSSPERPLSLP